jgi:hypothetical protein
MREYVPDLAERAGVDEVDLLILALAGAEHLLDPVRPPDVVAQVLLELRIAASPS